MTPSRTTSQTNDSHLYSQSFADIASLLREGLIFDKRRVENAYRRFKFYSHHTFEDKALDGLMRNQVQNMLERLARGAFISEKFIDANYLREHEEEVIKLLASEQARATMAHVGWHLWRLTRAAFKKDYLRNYRTLWRRLKTNDRPTSKERQAKAWQSVVVDSLRQGFPEKFRDIAEDGWTMIQESVLAADILSKMNITTAIETESDEIAEDMPDQTGLVHNPSQKKAYIAAAKIIAESSNVVGTHKNLIRVLNTHPEIRRWKPNTQRLMVHLADWLLYVYEQNGHLDPDGLQDDPADFAKQTTKIRTEKEGC